MNLFWEQIILARWLSAPVSAAAASSGDHPRNILTWVRRQTGLVLLCATVLLCFSAAPRLSAATRPHRKPLAKKAVREAPKPKAAGAAALLALAQRELDQRNFQVASEYANRAAKQAPTLDDYANYVRAEAELSQRNYRRSPRP